MKRLDLEGKRFGHLTVLKRDGRDKTKNVLWLCLCDCGKIVHERTGALTKHGVKSCGCKRFHDLAGQRFGTITVLEFVKIENHHCFWRCKCDCGNELILPTDKLKKACCNNVMKTFKGKDITSRRFGRLVAIEPVKRDSIGGIVWRCKCDCGNEYSVSRRSLVSGVTKSCGCLRKGRRKNHELINDKKF